MRPVLFYVVGIVWLACSAGLAVAWPHIRRRLLRDYLTDDE